MPTRPDPLSQAIEQTADELVECARIIRRGDVAYGLRRMRLVTGKMKLAAAGMVPDATTSLEWTREGLSHGLVVAVQLTSVVVGSDPEKG